MAKNVRLGIIRARHDTNVAFIPDPACIAMLMTGVLHGTASITGQPAPEDARGACRSGRGASLPASRCRGELPAGADFGIHR